MYWLIEETLIECTKDEALAPGSPFVAVLTPAEWADAEKSFDMGIDFAPDVARAFDTQAESNYDSVTGTIFIPDRADPDGPEVSFAFALDEKGIVFIDESGAAASLVSIIAKTRKWRAPGLASFLASTISQIIKGDGPVLYAYGHELDAMEDAILAGHGDDAPERIHEIRGDLRSLDDHYDHLMDLIDVLEENVNGFFPDEDLRYLRVVRSRLDKLRDQSATLRDQALQARDLHKTQLDIRQNHIMTVLTIVTAVFAPLSLLVGWYGMNFHNMPELTWRWAYPVFVAVCTAIAVASLVWFRVMKWL